MQERSEKSSIEPDDICKKVYNFVEENRSRMLEQPTKRPEFPYLDGIRGAAAVGIAFFHAYLFTGLSGQAESELPIVGWFLTVASLGVPVFIVLSGYVLMLPLISTPNLSYRHGIADFFRRRARRILPPYYAALVLSITLILAVPLMQSQSGTQWDSKIPLTFGNVASHVLLVHDFWAGWIGKINGPLWSVAVEWHIYFLMPLVLIPLWRRFRPLWVVAGVLVLTLTPAFVGIGDFAHPWVIGLFAAGMWAAQCTLKSVVSNVPRNVAVAFSAAVIVIAVLGDILGPTSRALLETAGGIAVAAGLAWAGQEIVAGRSPAIVRPFASKPMKHLGLFSYSIYLIHSPLLALANLLLLSLELPIVVHWLLMTFVAAPIAIAVSYGFFKLVEVHFLNSRQRHAEAELSDAAKTRESISQEARE